MRTLGSMNVISVWSSDKALCFWLNAAGNEDREINDSLFADDKDAVVLRRNACDGMLAGHLSLIVTAEEKRNRNCGN